MKTRILLVENREISRIAIRIQINRQPDMEVVGEAENCTEAIEKARELRPHVILMDINIPMLFGTEEACRVLAEISGMKILAFSTYCGDGLDSCRIIAGTPENILEGCDTGELLRMIHTIAGSVHD